MKTTINQNLNQSEQHKLPLFKHILERAIATRGRRRHTKGTTKRRHEEAQKEKCKVCKKTHLEKRKEKRRHVVGDIDGDVAGKVLLERGVPWQRSTL